MSHRDSLRIPPRKRLGGLFAFRGGLNAYEDHLIQSGSRLSNVTRPSRTQPPDFFSGVWTGSGTLRFVGLAGWFRRPESFRYRTQVRWVSQTRSEFIDVFEFGRRLEMPFVSEIVHQRKLRVSSPGMPGGAEIQLSENGYEYAPYGVL